MTEGFFDWDEPVRVPEPLPSKMRLYKACVEDVDRFPKAAARLMLAPAGAVDVERVGFVPGEAVKALMAAAREAVAKIEAHNKEAGALAAVQRSEITKLREENAKLRSAQESIVGTLKMRVENLGEANQRLTQEAATLAQQLEASRTETKNVREAVRLAMEDRDMWVVLAGDAIDKCKLGEKTALDLKAGLDTARMMIASEADALRLMNKKKARAKS